MRLSLGDPWYLGAPDPGAPIDWGSDHADGLIAFWPIWDGGGQGWEELVYGNKATVDGSGQFLWKPGEIWPAPYAGSSVSGSYPTAPIFNLTSFTLSLRLLMTAKSSSYGGVFSCRTAGSAGFLLTSESGAAGVFVPHFVVANAGGTEIQNKKTSTTYAVPFASFVHMVMTYDGTAIRFWSDGIEQSVVASGDSGYGASGNRFFFAYVQSQGYMYDARIYNRARPELGTELYDPSTRWKVFGSPRITTRTAGPRGGFLRPLALDGLGGTYMRDPLGV